MRIGICGLILATLAACQGTLSGARGTLSPTEKSMASLQYSESPSLFAYVCKPAGPGPFPAVIYHHGLRNGDSRGTCQALADAGFVGVSPVRRSSLQIRGQFQDVQRSIRFTRALKYVQPNRVGMIGFSRGGLLTVMTAVRRGGFKAMALLAPAPGRGHLDRVLGRASSVRAPSLILVAQNDQLRQRGRYIDLVELSRQADGALPGSRLIVYPPYGRRGHALFYRVRPQYWNDVVSFFRTRL